MPNEEIYLRDYVWMKHPSKPSPEKVKVGAKGDTSEIASKMMAGYYQVDEPETTKEK